MKYNLQSWTGDFHFYVYRSMCARREQSLWLCHEVFTQTSME